MDKNGLIAIIFALLFVSITCNASLVSHLRILVANEGNNSSETPQVSPTASPVNGSNANTSSINTEKSQLDNQKESQLGNQTNSNVTLPVDPKGSNKHDNDTNPLGSPSPPAGEKNDSIVDREDGKANETVPKQDGDGKANEAVPKQDGDGKANEAVPKQDGDGKANETVPKQDGDRKANEAVPKQDGDGKANEALPKQDGGGKANETVPKQDDDGSCEGSISSCRKQGMLACIKASKDSGLEEVFLVTKNEGEITLKVNVKLPNSLENNLADFEIPKHTSKRINISSVGKSNKLIVSSGSATCELAFVQSVSVDNIIQQLSFYSKQVTPIYAVYASFLITLLVGGTWACCRLRKRNPKDGASYQELEMAIPESASAVNVDSSEGWDHDWDDDWDVEIAVKSPSHQVRSVSADGLTSRSSKKDGWDNDWDD